MVGAMNLVERLLNRMAPAYRAATGPEGPLTTPPARTPADRDVLHYSTVFRAVQILETSIAGLPLRQLRDGVEIVPQLPIISRPDPNRHRSEFVRLTVGDMVVRGEAFWLKLRGLDGTVKGLRVLPASLVSITDLSGDPANPWKQYGYMGNVYRDEDILHLPFVSIPGRLHGLGPVEAGRAEINGAMDARDAKAMWFDEPAQPSGILSTDKMINDEIATNTKQRFEKNMKGVKVIGGGMTYTPLLLSPSDMQYLETQKFDTTLLSRLFGIPPKLMLAESGSSLTPADRDVLHYSTVFRAVQILETSIAGLPLRQLRDGVEIVPQLPIISRPDPNRHRSEFVRLTVGDMVVRGEAFWLKLRGLDGTVKGLRVLPASLVSITDLSGDPANPWKQYGYMGNVYRDEDILHLPFVSIPGRLHGLGPVEAGRAEINGAMDARDAKAMWFDEPAQPSGILSTDKMINDEIATNTKQRFEKNMKGVKVIGGGMTYTPLLLSPSDMQYLETQKFDTTLLSRLFGIPPKLMLAESGSSLTYSNVEQEWSQFADFTLNAYVQPMKDALSMVIPRGQTIDFGWDSFRRSDTKTRMETYKIAIEAGVMTVDEARSRENMPPLGGSQEGTNTDEA